jgi:hypothetical protein
MVPATAAGVAIALGVPWTTVLFVGAILCCPLMMLLMDHGHHEGLTITTAHDIHHHDGEDRTDRAA